MFFYIDDYIRFVGKGLIIAISIGIVLVAIAALSIASDSQNPENSISEVTDLSESVENKTGKTIVVKIFDGIGVGDK